MLTPKELVEVGDWLLKKDTNVTDQYKIKLAKILYDVAFQMEYYEEAAQITDSRFQTLLEINSSRKESNNKHSLILEECEERCVELKKQNEMLKEALYKS